MDEKYNIKKVNVDEINKMMKDLGKVLAILEYYPKQNKPYPVEEEKIRELMMEQSEKIICKMGDVNPFFYCFNLPHLDYWLCVFHNCMKTTDELTHETVMKHLVWALEDVNRLKQRDKIQLMLVEEFEGTDIFIRKNREYLEQLLEN